MGQVVYHDGECWCWPHFYMDVLCASEYSTLVTIDVAHSTVVQLLLSQFLQTLKLNGEELQVFFRVCCHLPTNTIQSLVKIWQFYAFFLSSTETLIQNFYSILYIGLLCCITDMGYFQNFHSYLFFKAYLAKVLQINMLCPTNQILCIKNICVND